ncbi:MAG: type III secretion system outer membrane ring subunit SctC, partial [Burkholderiaceae bacterium]
LFRMSEAQAATPPEWQDTLYSYRADERQSLVTVLSRFASTMGVQLRLADPALGRRQVTLNGKGLPATQFLDRLAQSQTLSWFVYQGELHVSSQPASISERLELRGQSAASARQALVGLGLLEAKFGWGELDTDPPMVVVSGPSAYVSKVRSVLATPKPPERERPRMMVFRLKNATAADRQIQARGQPVTLPGLASTLRDVMTAGRKAASSINTGDELRDQLRASPIGSTTQLAALPFTGAVSPALSLPLTAATDTALALPTPAISRSGHEGGGTGSHDKSEDAPPAIGAYAPLNAILVWDLPSRQADYQALIDQLDIPSRQVEINVTILDVNVDALREWAPDLSIGSGFARVQLSPSGKAPDASDSTGSMVLWATNRLTLRLNALESRGDAQVLSRPSVLTMDNSSAVLDMSQSVYVKLIGERTSDLRTVTAGTVLRVTPSIVGAGADANVRVALEIEDGSLNAGSGAQATPQVGNSTVSTQAVVRPGESLVVGGHRSQSSSTQKSGVPGLDSVPLLGWLFRTDSTVSNQRERLFIVTARVLPG